MFIRDQPDVVHLNYYTQSLAPLSSPKLVTAHSCLLSWWHAVKRTEIPPSWQRYREEVKKGLKKADWIVAPTKTMLSELIRHYDLMPQDMSVIHNGRDPHFFNPGRKEEMIMVAARLWDEAKNVRSLIGIAPHLPWRVCVAGDTSHPRMDNTVTTISGINLLGQLSSKDLAKKLSSASLYVLPALYEPFGLSILEAALSGCALVLGDIPSLREIWENCALFVSPLDTRALEQTILSLIEKSSERAEWASRAFKRALLLNSHLMALEYESLYQQLVTNSNDRLSYSVTEGRQTCTL
jgi:glycogen(starch) synthase